MKSNNANHAHQGRISEAFSQARRTIPSNDEPVKLEIIIQIMLNNDEPVRYAEEKTCRVRVSQLLMK
jgi:hypothetical protein